MKEGGQRAEPKHTVGSAQQSQPLPYPAHHLLARSRPSTNKDDVGGARGCPDSKDIIPPAYRRAGRSLNPCRQPARRWAQRLTFSHAP
jgi:hypothetical protein